MSSFEAPSKWLVVDDSEGDAEAIALAVSDLGGSCVVVRDLKSAARAIRKVAFDACIVDCYFAGSTKTGEDLVPALRVSNVSIPIIMTSSSLDPDLPRRVIEAGADIFVNKMSDYRTYKNAIKAALIQARTFRTIRCRELVSLRSSALYLSPRNSKQVDSICKRPNENVLILGPAGSGKSGVATLIAESTVKRNASNAIESIRSVDCGHFRTKDSIKALFGCSLSGEVGLLASVPGGVIVLENVHLLDKQTQWKLKEHLSKVDSTIADNVNRTRFIFTAKSENAPNLIADGFFETIADREVLLPGLSELDAQTLLLNAIQLAVRSEIEAIGFGDIRFEDGALEHFASLVRVRLWDNNFRGLRKVIRSAIERATEDSRSKVLAADFERAIASTPHNRTSGISENLQELFNDGEAKDLLTMLSEGKNYHEAQELLRRILIRFAAKRQDQNKSKMSEVLGLSRVQIHEHLRRMGVANNV